MATVYVARDAKLGREVALKVLTIRATAESDSERFRREVLLAAGLQHPHLCPVFDAGETDGHLWYTMPLVVGTSLRARLARETRLPVADVRRIVREAALGLQHAHDHRIVHRDIKPENLLWSHDGATVVCDFGIARRQRTDTTAGEAGPTLTATGLVLGTPAYMSPEQFDIARDVGPAADQYALALVAYELLTGRHAFASADGRAPGLLRTSVTPPPLSTHRPDVAGAVDAVLQRALAPEAVNRFPSIAAFASAFDDALASTASASHARGAPTRRRWRVVGAVAAVLVAGAVGTMVWSWSQTATADTVPRVVVLPFEAVGRPDDDGVADGVSDAVRGQLATADRIEVIERASSVSFVGTKTPLDRIGAALEARFVLTGTVRWSRVDSQVVITPELIERDGDRLRSVWTRRMTGAARDVFALQNRVAEEVARALDATVRGTMRAALRSGTRDLDAYEAFLRGEKLSQHGSAAIIASLRQAEAAYAQAVARDPRFGLAWSRLAWTRAFRLRETADSTSRALARATIDSARKYAGDEPFTSLAVAVGERWLRGPARGLVVAQQELARHPNDPLLLAQAAMVYTSVGLLDSARATHQRALARDPRSANVLLRAAVSANMARQSARAESLASRGLQVEPENLGLHLHYLIPALARGDTAEARRRLEDATLHTSERSVEQLASMLSSYELSWLLRPARRAELLAADSTAYASPTSWHLHRAELLTLQGDSAGARRELAYPARFLPPPAGRSNARGLPRSTQAAELFARVGRCDEAQRVATAYLSDVPEQPDYLGFGESLVRAASAFVLCGAPDAAIETLGRLLRVPSPFTAAWIAVDPRFASLRAHPRFGDLARMGSGAR